MRLRALPIVALAAHLTAGCLVAEVTCCNPETGEFLSVETEEACRAAGAVPATPTTISQLAPCLQKAQQQAAEALEALQGSSTGAPTTRPTSVAPGVGKGLLDGLLGGSPNSPTPTCCDPATGQWHEPAADGCADGLLADTPENLEATEACRTPSSGGTWSAETFEANIPNGDLEDWDSENRPADFMTFGIPPEQQPASGDGIDLQVVFRSDDAHTGTYSARLQNFDLRPELIRREPRAAAVLPPTVTTPAGMMTCKEPCATDTGQASGQGIEAASKVIGLRIEGAKSHLCGAYKGFLSPLDQLYVSVALFSDSDQFLGGSNLGAATSRFTQSSAEWVAFALPLHVVSGSLDEVAKVGIQVAMQPRGQIGMGGMVSADSVVKIDSLHFCDLMGLDVHHPEVLSADMAMVPDGEEADVGVQTFVNLDNDDQDGTFDHEDTDGVASEDELVKVRAYLPLESRGDVELSVSGNTGAVKLWNDPHKLDAFDEANQTFDVNEFMTLRPDGAGLERVVWVEGIAPSEQPKDVEINFRYSNQRVRDDDFEDRVVITVLGVESVEWRGKNAKDVIDPDPNWPDHLEPDGLRVFPGKRWQGAEPEASPNDEIDVAVTLNVDPVREVPIQFRSFDIDDPTADSDEVDDESKNEDNRGGGSVAPAAGGLPGGDEVYAHPFANREGGFTFRVTMQPGDNFRMVAAGDPDFLRDLHNDDGVLASADADSSVAVINRPVHEATADIALAKIPLEEQYTSDVLTVWRRLYVEVDSMQSVKNNTVTGMKVESYTMEPAFVHNGQTYLRAWLHLDGNLYQRLPDESKSGIGGYKDNFAGGRLKFGGNEYAVIESTASELNNDRLRVRYSGSWGPFSQGEMDKPIEYLRDDDVLTDGDSLPPLDTSRLQDAFAPAYVLPDLTSAPNPTRWATFRLHLKSSDKSHLQEVFRETFDGEPYHDDPDLWLVFLLHGFQGPLAEDGDGEAALAGVADGDPGQGPALTGAGDNGYGAIVYQESGRENAAAYASAGAELGWRVEDVAPHEVAHLFGALHSDGGLMSYDKIKTIEFEPITLNRIRSRKHP